MVKWHKSAGSILLYRILLFFRAEMSPRLITTLGRVIEHMHIVQSSKVAITMQLDHQ